MRGEKIMANSKLMLEGRLDADEFLKRIVYQQSTDDFGMLDVTLVNVVVEDDEEDCVDNNIRSTPSPTPSTSSASSSLSSASSHSVSQCALCDGVPELLLLPCFDFCVCSTCWQIVENNNKQPSCPSCKSAVTEAKKIKFYQQ